ncbi:Hemin import ATP-binding protein HmuV [Hydrogenovibrio crunogenus]|uniref:Hemin import ATP-binding protein HmuV n=1 Tax=Hydrogenovibrio crunogenus TaxID=39765 RepID=A0A4P7NX97_9GAMM|nr:heme ABC transporter ATP-binding protein [Hydrogenovibrio crunogenus]QBZ82148.1 Hemin import ATP-binding protein HmuV [Hydrogenovibrio crunogenus]
MLTANKLCVERLGHRILSDVSVEISPGQVVAILGANGAGKSTLLHCLSGDLNEAKQHVLLNGKNLESYTAQTLATVRAVMPQSVQMDFAFLVSELVEMGVWQITRQSEKQQRVDDALALFGIEALKSRDYQTLSGGEQQRVQLARVVAQVLAPITQADAPRYLLLDECTANLDFAHQHQVFEVVKKLADSYQIGIVVVLHDMNLAAQYADHLILLKQGKVLDQGSVETMLVPSKIEELYDFPVQVLSHPKGWPMVVPA